VAGIAQNLAKGESIRGRQSQSEPSAEGRLMEDWEGSPER
jgi:hypothetical protein